MLYLLYNPNPSGGITELSERETGYVDGLGPFEMLLTSDIVSIYTVVG